MDKKLFKIVIPTLLLIGIISFFLVSYYRGYYVALLFEIITVKKFIFMALIIVVTLYAIDLIYKIIRKCFKDSK